jgi:hypothetical protein
MVGAPARPSGKLTVDRRSRIPAVFLEVMKNRRPVARAAVIGECVELAKTILFRAVVNGCCRKILRQKTGREGPAGVIIIQ